MSYDPYEAREAAAYDDFLDQLSQEFRDSALENDELYDKVVEVFRDARLPDYYFEHPEVLVPARDALVEAHSLLRASPRAALILAFVASEVCLRDAMLILVLHGSFHTSASADILVRLLVRTGGEKLTKALLRVLACHTGTDLRVFKRTGASKPLWERCEICRLRETALSMRPNWRRKTKLVLRWSSLKLSSKTCSAAL